jgi:MYXO-CTERM domain-containing protein
VYSDLQITRDLYCVRLKGKRQNPAALASLVRLNQRQRTLAAALRDDVYAICGASPPMTDCHGSSGAARQIVASMAQNHDNARASGLDHGLHRAPHMTTRRSAFLSFLLVALGLGVPVPRVAAQATAGTGGISTSSGGILWVLNKIGTDDYKDSTNRVPVNKAQCDAKANLSLQLTHIPQGYKYLETWLGTTCNEANRGSRVGTGGVSCTLVDDKEQNPVTTEDLNFQVSVEKMCAMGDGARSYFILPVNSLNATDAVMTYANVTLNVDQTPPSPATSVMGGKGQTEIEVKWMQPIEAYFYWIVVDTNVGANSGDASVEDDSGAAETGDASIDAGGVVVAGGASGSAGSSGASGSAGSSGASGSTASSGPPDHGPPECTSKYLTAGRHFDPRPDNLPPGVKSFYVDKMVSSRILSGADIGVPVAAVAVVADDLAKNDSVLSNIDCVHVVKTNGFWDGYKANGGDAVSGCTCSTPGAGHSTTSDSAWAGLAGLLGLAGYFRTRRRA